MDREETPLRAIGEEPVAASDPAEPREADGSEAPVMLTDAVCGQAVVVKGEPRLA